MNRDFAMYTWIKREEAANRIYQEVDGFWVWAPAGDGGSLNEYALLEMAKYLEARNAYWNWQINHDPAICGSESNPSPPQPLGDA